MNKAKPFLVNENPEYRFSELANMPEAQLVMLVPRRFWQRLAEYINTFEAVTLAGRFGADPGDYEWEWLTDPEGVRWWRRAKNGRESLFGMVVGLRKAENIEVYGMVSVDERSPFWAEVIPEEASNPMPAQAKLMARQGHYRSEQEALAELYRDYFRNRGMLTEDEPGQLAHRKGTIREVERFRDAFKQLIERAVRAALPSETGRLRRL